MHHLKETVIDEVKFVLIPEELHDKLAHFMDPRTPISELDSEAVAKMWKDYDPEVFDGI